VVPLPYDSPEAFLLVDDSVQDKRYSRFIEVAKRRYLGNGHGLVTGMSLVNLAHRSGEAGDLLPLNFGLYAPELDQKTKNDHFLDLFQHVVNENKLLVSNAIFDGWYAGSTN